MAPQTPSTQRTTSRAAPFIVLLTAIVVVILLVWYVGGLLEWPAAVQASAANSGRATLNLRIVPAVNTGPFPNWVGYQVADPNVAQSATILHVPANTWVTMTIRNYDSAGPLRNDFFNLVQGVKGDSETVNGKIVKAMDPGVVSHTFSIPDLGVSVPMAGIPGTPSPTSFMTMRFTFFTGPAGHKYRWQCFDPCGYGSYANGGPMQTLGYMGGYLLVS